MNRFEKKSGRLLSSGIREYSTSNRILNHLKNENN